MPRNVRNFWIEADVDGKKQAVATGPRRSDGGFDLTILVREEGSISNKKLVITGRSDNNGTLALVAKLEGENLEQDQVITLLTNR